MHGEYIEDEKKILLKIMIASLFLLVSYFMIIIKEVIANIQC